jgi:DNA repair photolyase
MQISSRQAKGILTPQTGGFLVNGEFPFTHALSPYTGCAFGNTTCGLYCYAPFLPSWQYRPANMKTFAWGEAIEVKENAAELLADELVRLKPERRQLLRVFCSATPDRSAAALQKARRPAMKKGRARPKKGDSDAKA